MKIRQANLLDVNVLHDLLATVQALHAKGRPDIFIEGTHKYTIEQVKEIVSCDHSPVYVLIDEEDKVGGYAFCQIKESSIENNLRPLKSFYIDDLCVREDLRGKGYGKMLYDYTLKMAKEYNCYHLTLNVWHLNQSALRFYEKLGMKPLKSTMEQIL